MRCIESQIDIEVKSHIIIRYVYIYISLCIHVSLYLPPPPFLHLPRNTWSLSIPYSSHIIIIIDLLCFNIY